MLAEELTLCQTRVIDNLDDLKESMVSLNEQGDLFYI
jgi:hypothetical protein